MLITFLRFKLFFFQSYYFKLYLFNYIYYYSLKQVFNKTGQLFGCFEFSLKPELKTKVPGEFTNIDFGEKASRKKCIEYCSERFL